MAKMRKPTIYEQKQIAKKLLLNEIETRKTSLNAVEQRVDQLTNELKALEHAIDVPKTTIRKISDALNEQIEVAESIRNWLKVHG